LTVAMTTFPASGSTGTWPIVVSGIATIAKSPVAAAAAGVAAIDTAFADVSDVEGLRVEAEAARRDGFAGKMAMDAVQAHIINEVLAPRSIPLTELGPS